ncbi:MAG: amidohydrolase, partial [Acidobacteria bacterium]|nr:amidohydrolase [Acidobacteriota bacterium]
LFLLLAATVAAAANADLILHNGRIVTVDQKFSIQQAIAIQGGRITAVGTNEAVLRAERGARTRMIDLAGRAVLPGLIDSHVHPQGAGQSEFRRRLPKFDSFAAVQSYIRERARTTPKGQWIVVPRTFPTRLKEMRMPTREVLDVTTEHPVMFDASYVAVANTYALKHSGITRDTANPPGGEIVKDARGEPNGILKNAQRLLKGLRGNDSFTEAESVDALEGMLKRYVAAGLTSIIDRALTPDGIERYRKLKSAGRLPLRVAMTWRIDASAPAEQLVKQIRESPLRGGEGDDWLRLSVFKVTLDGGMTIGTAYQRHPYGPFGRQLYGKTNPDDRGQLFVEPAKLTAAMRAARDKGFALTAHSQGGGAIDALLDTFEALNRERPLAPTRSHLMHASFQSPEAIARAARMGVLADVQPAWLYLDGPALEKVFGNEGMRYFFPLRSYLRGGVTIAGGSDHMIGWDKNGAVNPYNPFLGMWTAVTRRMVDGRVLHAEERIGREQALRMYTIWGARMQKAEAAKGSLEPGKLADLVVIDRDYLTCPEEQIQNIEPVMTIIGGKVAWEHSGR